MRRTKYERRQKTRSRETGCKARGKESAALYLRISRDQAMAERSSRSDGRKNGSGG
jgi:hypothetical protein